MSAKGLKLQFFSNSTQTINFYKQLIFLREEVELKTEKWNTTLKERNNNKKEKCIYFIDKV